MSILLYISDKRDCAKPTMLVSLKNFTTGEAAASHTYTRVSAGLRASETRPILVLAGWKTPVTVVAPQGAFALSLADDASTACLVSSLAK